MKVIQKKICLLGEFSVGKTSLIRRFVEERFDENYLSTIGVHMSRKRLERAEYALDFFIWDLAGGEDFKVVGANYLRGSAGAIIVCDLTRKETLTALPYYAGQIQSLNPQAALVFVANKADLVMERTVAHDAIIEAITAFGNTYLLTSAKTGQHVNEAFAALADQMEK
ncbi:MAG: GTP-binding protein [Ardenticatenaceae bacterium]|nr:GTP-binding protein [Ardenticatenaceae bacterium]MCB9444260.1 GTP-binding protein [Ardenticatenaceae bacterium]